VELVVADEHLVDDGFVVFAYTNNDPVVAIGWNASVAPRSGRLAHRSAAE
jgi:thiazole synthase ThiGH ThiG subunit